MNLFNSGSAVKFKFDTTVGIPLIPFKNDKRVPTPSSNSWFPKVWNEIYRLVPISSFYGVNIQYYSHKNEKLVEKVT